MGQYWGKNGVDVCNFKLLLLNINVNVFIMLNKYKVMVFFFYEGRKLRFIVVCIYKMYV